MSELVLTGPLLLAVGVAALAGVVSFASPCVLPLVPGFLGYLGGMAPGRPGGAGPARAGADPARGRLVLGAVLFVLGFTAVFLLMSVAISGLGLALVEHQRLLLRVGGAVVVALGLVMILQPGASWQLRWRPAAGLAGAPLLGVAFGLGFTACTGPALAAIQTLGTSILPGEGQLARAVVLGTAYSLGLGLPFVLVAAGLGWVSRASRWLRDRHLLIQRVGGTLLVVLGLLMVTGVWAGLTAWVQAHLVSGFETVL
ncbi:Cytochrome c-type biogenesis protein CcdA [Serinicoccus hydrothermalis]|uniref:Cytochrome c-type biogenesis protein CcdA n=1 Tax=Serinicoccus hydrothermalis TaxID=1758689 RepID=A0A1B1NBL4_9MICO|nr:cytochrome c biogenesis protein CcdA [Serinicoccus hydrothermalis]ANS78816.1 Cytochrome c-type biogenesis protein CcdA [Serinicoccus hydrothermalis]